MILTYYVTVFKQKIIKKWPWVYLSKVVKFKFLVYNGAIFTNVVVKVNKMHWLKKPKLITKRLVHSLKNNSLESRAVFLNLFWVRVTLN